MNGQDQQFLEFMESNYGVTFPEEMKEIWAADGLSSFMVTDRKDRDRILAAYEKLGPVVHPTNRLKFWEGPDGKFYAGWKAEQALLCLMRASDSDETAIDQYIKMLEAGPPGGTIKTMNLTTGEDDQLDIPQNQLAAWKLEGLTYGFNLLPKEYETLSLALAMAPPNRIKLFDIYKNEEGECFVAIAPRLWEVMVKQRNEYETPGAALIARLNPEYRVPEVKQ